MATFDQEAADLLTLGQYLANIMQIADQSNDQYLFRAADFIANDHKDLHKITKRLLVGCDIDLQIRLLQYIASSHRCHVVSKNIYMRTNNAVCIAKVFRNATAEDCMHEPMHVQDFAGACNTFIALTSLESIAENAGRELLTAITSAMNVPVIIEAGYLHYGDYEIEDRDNVDSGILSRLVSMYESLGFADVNRYFGSYEEAVTMLYPSGYSAIPVEPQTIKI